MRLIIKKKRLKNHLFFEDSRSTGATNVNGASKFACDALQNKRKNQFKSTKKRKTKKTYVHNCNIEQHVVFWNNTYWNIDFEITNNTVLPLTELVIELCAGSAIEQWPPKVKRRFVARIRRRTQCANTDRNLHMSNHFLSSHHRDIDKLRRRLREHTQIDANHTICIEK